MNARRPSKGQSHHLGGSNNLMQERKRREKAEQQLEQTNQQLHHLVDDIAPKVDALGQAVETLERENKEQIALEEASHATFQFVHQQLELLRRQQVDMQAQLTKHMDDKIDRTRYELHQANEQAIYHVQLEIHSLKDDLVHIRSEVETFQEAANTKLAQHQAVLDTIRHQNHKDAQFTATSLRDIDTKLVELDGRLFELDKEQLKIKLCLPPSVATRQCFANGATAPMAYTENLSSMSKQKFDELHLEIAAVKHDVATQRSADRMQFEMITTRLREMSKTIGQKHDFVVDELQNLHDKLAHLATKLPVEMTHRVEMLQEQWEADLATLKLAAKKWEQAPLVASPSDAHLMAKVDDVKDMLFHLQAQQGHLEQSLSKYSATCHGNHIESGTQAIKLLQDVSRMHDAIVHLETQCAHHWFRFHDLIAELRQAFIATISPAQTGVSPTSKAARCQDGVDCSTS
ncbi:hypothetical protein AC1031_013141 [Aphanomyces cochlioides]|nr:hypothetical protein AC1031_013141 [Aphanomyces cochlioides]